MASTETRSNKTSAEPLVAPLDRICVCGHRESSHEADAHLCSDGKRCLCPKFRVGYRGDKGEPRRSLHQAFLSESAQL
jgi:hypothetical protein